MRAALPVLASLSLACITSGALAQQQPAADADPFAGIGAPAPESLTGIDCELVIPSFDLTTVTTDIGILGIARSDSNGKWFFSGRYGPTGAANSLWIFDSDKLGRPDASTMRSVSQSPLRVAPVWGHRDGEWDPIGGMTYWGDDAAKIMEFNPNTETWTGNGWSLPNFGQAATRAVAVITDPITGNLRAYGCDFGGSVQEYILAPGTGATSTVISGPRAVCPSPGSTYGMTIVNGPSGPNSALAIFGQLSMTCSPGVGLHRITVVDIPTGTTLWTRSGDFSLLGATPNFEGGIAGGIQVTTVAGQRVLACLHQAASDAVAFVPFQGFGQHGADECSNAYVYLGGSPVPGGTTGFNIANGFANGIALVYLDITPGFAIPLGCGQLDVGLSFAPFTVIVDSLGNGSLGPFPIPNSPLYNGVTLYLDTILADVNGIGSTNPIELFIANRCW